MFVDGPKISIICGQNNVDRDSSADNLVMVAVNHEAVFQLEKGTEQVVIRKPQFDEILVDVREHCVVWTVYDSPAVVELPDLAVFVIERNGSNWCFLVNPVNDLAFSDSDKYTVLACRVFLISEKLFKRVDIIDITDSFGMFRIGYENESY